MKLQLFLLLAIVCVAQGAPTLNKYYTALDALKMFINRHPIGYTPEISTKMRVFTATAEGLKDKLIKAKVCKNLAAKIADGVKNQENVRIVESPLFATKTQAAVCFFRKIQPLHKNNYICVLAKVPRKGSSVKKSQWASAIASALTHTPAPIAKYHSFTNLSVRQFNSLGSPQSSAQLDNILKQSESEKNKVMYELNNNKNDPFIAKLFKNGISHYTSSATVESVEKVDAASFMDYAEYLTGVYGILPEKKADFKDTLEIASLASKGDWQAVDFIYKLNKGTAKYVSIMTTQDPATNTFDFLNANIQAGFELGPDVFVSTKSKSSFFGLFQSTTIEIKYLPAELTKKSIQLLFKFFKVSAFEKFKKFRHL